jgi:16S rRNA (guanine1207-N2)-methyltransferase
MAQQISRRASDRGRRYSGFSLEIGGRTFAFSTQAGVFSQDGPDEGSMLLLDMALPHIKPHQTVLDLGTGVGLIGVVVAGLLTRGEMWMTDVDIRAVRLAEENVGRNGVTNAHVLLSDITLDLPPKLRFDVVLSNPPTHSGKEVLQSFVTEAYDVLRPGGAVYVVVNRLLSIRDMMEEAFGTVEQMERHKGFIVFRAEKQRKRPGEE